MSSIHAGEPVSTTGDRKTVRCFAHILRESDPQSLADFAGSALDNWAFETFALHAVVESQDAESLSEAIERSKQVLALYPESMHLIIGAGVMEDSSLQEPLHLARKEFGRGRLAIIYLGASAPADVFELDGVIRTKNVQHVQSEVGRVMRMLNYQRPVPKSELPCSPQSRLIANQKDFIAALRTRFNVYDLMGYIPKQYRSTEAGIELDNLDKYSLHYASDLPGENNDQPGAVLRLITRELQHDSAAWVKQTLADHPDRTLQRSARAAQFQELPVFNSLKCLEKFQSLLQFEDSEYCELSRVVVDESCRGMGLSRDLIEFALSDARQRGIHCVFLACVPEQVTMYEKYGFQHFPSDIVRFARIRQPAQAMFQFLSSQDA